ncbi:MAG: gliding motility-associated C-terminal domain-containing protein [Bacteroidales bacterium]|nr:gliding motility-associated C-terminal domain-containing protein [Bacteroidales bacterium]
MREQCGHRRILYLQLLAVLVVMPVGVRGQLAITPGCEFPANWTPDSLVRNMLLGTGVRVSNVRLNGSSGIINNGSDSCGMIGIFTTGEHETNLGIEAGIILANGCVSGVAGVNDDEMFTAWECTCSYRSSLLEEIIGDEYVIGWNIANDVVVLEFDFIPTSDSIEFEYVFGSEEYPEYVYSFNDAFGFFISGQNPYGGQPYVNKNIALIPNTDMPITINNVNDRDNSEYYIDNTGGEWVQYDGFTVPLTAAARVVPNTTYHLILALADASDWAYDSGVLLKANSLTAIVDTIYDTICYGECYQFVDTTVCDDGMYVHGEGRSSVTLFLHVRESNATSYQNDTIAQSYLPWSYEGLTYTMPAMNDSVMLTDQYGCDSLVLYSLYVTYATYDSVQICKGEVYELEGQQFSEKGDYMIVYVTAQGCDSSHYLHLDVARKPEARMHVEPDRVDVECREIKVYDQSKWETSRSWYLDGEYMGNESTMVFTYPIEKDSVKLTLVSFTGYECRDTAEAVVYYDRCALWVPNVFAPELEGNDRFRVASACIEEMEMWIYNREGMQVFHSTNVEEPWDGTNQRTGEKCPGGSYVYTINYLMTNHPITKKSKTGMVMLMR